MKKPKRAASWIGGMVWPAMRRRAAGAIMVLPAFLAAAQPAFAARQTVTVYASADNALTYNSLDESAQNEVSANGDLAVGCFWVVGAFINSWICFSSALKFDLPSAVENRPIYGATLRLNGYVGAEDFQTQYRIAAFASNWSPATITFANTPQYFTSHQRFIYPPTFNPIDIDVTSIVSNWASGAWPNYGFFLEDVDFVFPYYTANRVTYLYSMDYYDHVSHRPQLLIDYDGAALPVLTFSANPVTIAPGESSLLSWSASDADTCTLPGEFFNFPASGNWQVSPSASRSYTLTCFGAAGSASQSVTVNVSAVPLLNFWADESVIELGSSTTLHWRSTNALGCTFYRIGGLFAQTIPENGDMAAAPSTTTSYRVTCENFAGSAQKVVTIVVPEAGAAASGLCALLALATLRRVRRKSS